MIGSPGTGNGQFNNPFELAIDSEDKLYVVDNDNNRVQVFDSTGKYLTQFGNSGAGHERLQDPVGIAVNSLGDVYVADGRDSDIHVFTPIG
jgi:DNA-binding beta-propeller fold protein YncE